MSLLSSKFDVISQDNPIAYATLGITLAVASPPSPSFNSEGTPTAGVIPPGALVTMDAAGKAVLATTPNVAAANPILVFITVDGNMDFSGSLVQKLTCLHGGIIVKSDQYDAGAYVPNAPVTCNAGKFKLAAAGDQIIGYVSPLGLNATEGVLHVLLPQGCQGVAIV